jgi:transposase
MELMKRRRGRRRLKVDQSWIVALKSAGVSFRQIAVRMSISDATVRRAYTRFQAEGCVAEAQTASDPLGEAPGTG